MLMLALYIMLSYRDHLSRGKNCHEFLPADVLAQENYKNTNDSDSFYFQSDPIYIPVQKTERKILEAHKPTLRLKRLK